MPLTTRMPARRRPVWWTKNGDFDPLPLLRSIAQPSLVIYGADDEQDNVPVARSVEVLRSLGKPESHLAVIVIPGVGHGLTRSDDGELDPEFRRELVAWIRSH